MFSKDYYFILKTKLLLLHKNAIKNALKNAITITQPQLRICILQSNVPTTTPRLKRTLFCR